MAMPQKRKAGYILQPKLNGKRHFLNLGKVKRDAHLAATHIDRLIDSSVSKQPIPPDTYHWAMGTPLRAKLVEMGLMHSSTTMTASELVNAFYRQYCQDNPKVSTQKACWRGIKLVAEHYKKQTLLELSQNGWDESEFLKYIKTDRAEATWSKAISNIRRLGRWAVDQGHLDKAPFQTLKGGSKTGKRHYVDAGLIRIAIANCGEDDLRIIVALARFAGLRIPSDLCQLTWDRVNWERNVMTVYSPKTDKERVIPIFPDLKTELDYQWEKHGERSNFVVVSDGLRSPEKNLRNRFRRLLVRCGIKPWPKLFQNLRASCETDFLKQFPIHEATSYIGNSPQVALQHYAIVTNQAVNAATKVDPFEKSCTDKSPVADKLHRQLNKVDQR